MGGGKSPMAGGGGGGNVNQNKSAKQATFRQAFQRAQAAGVIGSGGAAPAVPADFTPTVLSPIKAISYARDNGWERVTDTAAMSMALGTPVLVSQAILDSGMASQSDPDGVQFVKGTFSGISHDAFKRPIVTLDNGRRIAVHTEYPYENLFKVGS